MIDEEYLLQNEDRLQIETKDNFFKYLKENGIDFDDIDEAERMPKFMINVIKNEPYEFTKFNNIIYKLNKTNMISIIDSMTYLVDDWFEPQIVLKCLDELNRHSLETLLKKKHNLNKNTGLEDIFV